MRAQTEARMLSASQRVRRGAAWLDTKRLGWWNEINVGQLDIDSARHCVIAQLNGGSYYSGIDRMGVSWDFNASAYGFSASSNADSAALNHEWRTLILRRQYGERPPPRWFTRLARWITRRP